MAITKINSLSITYPLAFSAGTVSLPSITTSGDTNTGVFFPAADTMAFAEGGAESMRINSAGDVLINTTSNVSTSKGLKINNGGAEGSFIYFGVTGSGSWNNIAFFRGTDGSLTQVGNITTTGSATSYVTSSDYRLKENVNYNFDATTRLKQLKPARFNFKADANKTVDGFIAHEVSEIVPEAIVGTKDEIDSKGNPVHQGIDQSKLTPILTKALQEAIAKIESLEARLIALESK